MRKFFKIRRDEKNSLMRSSFIELLAIIVVIFLASYFVLYVNTVDSIEDKFDALNYEDTKKISNLSDIMLKELETGIINASADSNVQTYIYANNPEEIFADIDNRLLSCLSTLKGTKSYIDSIYVYSDKRKTIFSEQTDYAIEDFDDAGCLECFSSAPHIFAWSRQKRGVYPHMISIMLKVSESGDSGAVIINIDTLRFVKNLKSFSDIEEFYIVSGNNEIMYSDATQDISKNVSEIKSSDIIRNKDIENIERDGERVSVSNVKSKYYNWSYINVSSANQYVKEMNGVLRNFSFMLLCFILASIIIAYAYALKNMKPIRSIIDIIEKPPGIDAVQKLKHSEIRYLARQIIMMMEANKQLKTELNETISKTNKAHTLMLQSQINPHFIYNTLNIINWTIEEETQYRSRSSEMIIGLSALLRESIDFKNILIPLSQELKYTMIYIDLMKSRYDSTLDVVIDIAHELEDKLVIKLFMQPLIENCIVHGFDNMQAPGTIKITGALSGDRMQINIADNGRGIDDETIEKLNQKPVFDEMYAEKRVGLKNVKFRLDTIWGESAGLTVKRENGTVIAVNIPVA